MTLLSYVSASSARSCTTTASAVVVWVMVLAFDVLHCRIIVSIRSVLVSRQVRNSLLHVNLFALQQFVHDLTKLEISCTEPCRVS
jgi:hypothetical protein